MSWTHFSFIASNICKLWEISNYFKIDMYKKLFLKDLLENRMQITLSSKTKYF